MSQDNNARVPESLQAVLEMIEPGSSFVAIHSLAGDFSNSTDLVNGRPTHVQCGWIVGRLARVGR
jgi:hypothetical protein